MDDQDIEAGAARYYGPLADGYVSGGVTAPLKHALLETLAHGRVLDVGCANGTHLDLPGREVHGIDLAPEMVEIARINAPDATVTVASATDLPYPDGHFDCVWSFSALVLVPDLPAAIREMARVTRPGGTVILDLYNAWHPHRIIWGRHYSKAGVKTSYVTWGRAKRLIRNAGLDLAQCHMFGAHKPGGPVRFADRWVVVCRKD